MVTIQNTQMGILKVCTSSLDPTDFSYDSHLELLSRMLNRRISKYVPDFNEIKAHALGLMIDYAALPNEDYPDKDKEITRIGVNPRTLVEITIHPGHDYIEIQLVRVSIIIEND